VSGQKSYWYRLLDTIDLPVEANTALPLIEIVGNRRVLIENHRGVSVYGKDEICIRTKNGEIIVQGCELTLAQMTKERLIITGTVERVSLCGRLGAG